VRHRFDEIGTGKDSQLVATTGRRRRLLASALDHQRDHRLRDHIRSDHLRGEPAREGAHRRSIRKLGFAKGTGRLSTPGTSSAKSGNMENELNSNFKGHT
jgi:hypothetical protein